MNTRNRLLLALDSGTQSSRALLFDPQGTILATGSRLHQPMQYPEQDAVEQDPFDIRDCLFGAIRDCLDAWGGDAGEIAAASLTTQRNTVVSLGADGNPLGALVSWLDRREATLDSEPTWWLRLGLGALGKDSLLSRLLSKSWPRIFRDRDPALLENAWRVTPIEGWLHQQLVGRVAVAPGGVVGPWPFDVKRRQWSQFSMLYTLLGFQRGWLPEIVEAGQRIGFLTAWAAEQTGLPRGLPFFASGGDKQTELLGAGLRAGDRSAAGVSLGTGSAISIPSPEAVTDRAYGWLTLAAAEPAVWTHEYLIFRGMWTVRWFARNFARELEAKAAETGRAVEALLCDEGDTVRPGCDGLMVFPRWSPTIQHPFETGSCVGWRETHTRAHFFRALLEGIGFDLRRGLETLEGALDTTVREIRIGGGGAQSKMVVQIIADILGLPVRCPESLELSARGAAMVAAAGVGVHPTFAAAVAAMTGPATRVEPNPTHAATYTRLYREAYLPGLSHSRQFSRVLRDATGS